MEHSDLERTKEIVRIIAQTALDNEQHFSELDAVVGDGDFGYSLARGFEKLLQDWDTLEYNDIGTFLKKVSITITSRIGGTSGPIWGTGFLRAATTINGKQKVERADAIAMLRAAIAGIKQRGQADLGDKTLLDALVPATDQLEKSFKAGEDIATTLQKATTVAKEKAEATKELEAKRGRASYAGERSIGSVDAGATAIAVIFEQIHKNWHTY